MARPVYVEHLTDIDSTGVVDFATTRGKKVPARGHPRWGLEVVTKDAGGGADVDIQLLGTNDHDPAKSDGEVLIDVTNIASATTTHASTETSGNIRNSYKYVFVNVVTATDLVIDELRLYGSGQTAQE